MAGARRYLLLALVLLLVFLIGGRQALGTALTWIAISIASAIALGYLAMWLIRRRVRREMGRLRDTLLGNLQAPPPPPPRGSRDEAIDADFEVRK